ncbi:hypothetical protein BZL43_11725 [Pseudomonas sp. PICF141]|nr:hypothetical protein BZL43_11725 [Pseudomonas sp. PICF141]
MVEYPGMWVQIRSLFKVGTVVAVVRLLPMIGPEPAARGVSTWFGGGLGRRIIGRRLTIEQGMDIEKIAASLRSTAPTKKERTPNCRRCRA